MEIRCGVCGGGTGCSEIRDWMPCNRCGAEVHADGSVSYKSSRRDMEEMQDNIAFHDSGYRDRTDWERHHGRRY